MRFISALAIILSIASGCTAKHADDTRDRVISNMNAILKSWDSDDDKRLSRSEVEAMVEQSFEKIARNANDGQAHPELDAQRKGALAFYADQDANRDGYLTLGELLQLPLATFDCSDKDKDGKLSKKEVFDGMARCPSVNLQDYAAK